MAVKVIETYETSDGKSFKNYNLADTHEHSITLILTVKKVLQSHFGERAMPSLEQLATDLVETKLGHNIIKTLLENS